MYIKTTKTYFCNNRLRTKYVQTKNLTWISLSKGLMCTKTISSKTYFSKNKNKIRTKYAQTKNYITLLSHFPLIPIILEEL